MVRQWQTDRYLFLRHFYRYEKARDVPLVFVSYVLRGPTWELKGYLLGLMDLDIR